MKILKACLVVLSFLFVYGFIIADDPCLQWNKNDKLIWTDFMATAPIDPEYGAVTDAGIFYTSSIIADSLNLKINACFIRNQSWSITKYETSYALNHEQRHFDIAEINARKFREYALKWDGKYNISTYLSEGCESFLRSMNVMQDLYDKETNHSVFRSNQQKWDRKIDSLLNVYSQYENPLVKLPWRK